MYTVLIEFSLSNFVITMYTFFFCMSETVYHSLYTIVYPIMTGFFFIKRIAMEGEDFFTMSATHKLISYFFNFYVQLFFIQSLYSFNNLSYCSPTSWSSGNAFIFWCGRSEIQFLFQSNEHSVANGSPPLGHFFKWSCVGGSADAEMGPINFFHALA